MCGDAPTPPPAPDYAGAATAQGAANKETAIASASLSNPNIYNPYGSQEVTYAPTGPNGEMQPTIRQSLTPAAQQTLDAQNRVSLGLSNLSEKGLNQASDILGKPFQYNGPDIQTSLGNVPGAQTSLDLSNVAHMPVNAGTTGQEAILSRLDPALKRQEESLRQQMANQGIGLGSEAYTTAQGDFNQGRNDLYLQAAKAGIDLDLAANNQGFNQALQSGQFANQGIGQNYNQRLGAAEFGNTAAAQSLQQQLGLYNAPLNQINALRAGAQIQNPQFQQYQGQNIAAAPIYQATGDAGKYATDIYGQQMAGYNAQQNAIGSAIGSIGGIAAGKWL